MRNVENTKRGILDHDETMLESRAIAPEKKGDLPKLSVCSCCDQLICNVGSIDSCVTVGTGGYSAHHGPKVSLNALATPKK
jgi:hypothetical protein